MNFEAIETAFELLLKMSKPLKVIFGTHAYDAHPLSKNSYYLGGWGS